MIFGCVEERHVDMSNFYDTTPTEEYEEPISETCVNEITLPRTQFQELKLYSHKDKKIVEVIDNDLKILDITMFAFITENQFRYTENHLSNVSFASCSAVEIEREVFDEFDIYTFPALIVRCYRRFNLVEGSPLTIEVELFMDEAEKSSKNIELALEWQKKFLNNVVVEKHCE